MECSLTDGARTRGAEAVRDLREREQPLAARKVAESVRPLLRDLRHGSRGFSQRDVIDMLQAAVRHGVVVETRRAELRRCLEKKIGAELVAALPVYRGPAYSACEAEVVDALAAYIEELVGKGFLGYVIYRGEGGVAAYSYRLHRVTPSWWTCGWITAQTLLAWDPDAPFGQRKTYADIARVWGRALRVNEEHVHHLQRMSEVPLGHRDSHLVPAPSHVGRFRSGLLGWAYRYLHLMSGTIVEEEIHVCDERRELLRSTILRTLKDSPAIVFGDVVLAGWSSDDLR